MLVVGVSVMRVCSPIYHISGISHISHLIKKEKLSRSMGFHNAFGSLGSSLGLISLAFFLSSVGWRLNYVFWSVPIFFWGIFLLKSPQIQISEFRKTEQKKLLKSLPLVLSTGFIVFLFAIGLREVGNTATSTFLTTYLVENRGLSEITASLIFGLGPFMGIFGSLYGGYLGEKIGAKRAFYLVIFCCVISLLVLLNSVSVNLVTLVFLVYAFFASSVYSPMNTIVAGLTSTKDRGLGFGVYFLTEGLIISITPILTATIIGLSDIWIIFPLSIIFLVASVVVLHLFSYLKK
jgi:MFS family permease